MNKHSRTDFIETNLKGAILDSFENHTTWITETETKFVQFRERLIVVREEKEKKQMELLGLSELLKICSSQPIWAFDLSTIYGRSWLRNNWLSCGL